MEYTEEQLNALHRAGLTDDGVLNDVMEVTALVEEINGLFSDVNGSNVQAKFQRFAEISDFMDNLDEKYLDPASTKILEDAYEDFTGVHPEDIDITRLEEDLESFSERYENDPDFEAEIDAGLGDYMDEFNERMAASTERGEDLDARREQLEANYEQEQTGNAIDNVLNAVDADLDCEIDECTEEQADMQELQERFDRILTLKGEELTIDEKIQAYEDFLDKYEETIITFSMNGNDEDDIPPDQRFVEVRGEIDRIIGIPPTVLPDQGIDYHQAIADKIKTLIDEAEHNDDLTGNERSQIYAEASMLMVDSKYVVLDLDQDTLERLSGATFEYLSERAEFYYEDSVPEEPEEAELEEHAAVIDQGIPAAGAGIAAVSAVSTMKV